MNDAFPKPFHLLIFLAVGALGAVGVPSLVEALSPTDAPALWWAARALGLLAYLALWLSMLFGVFIAGRGAGGLVHQPTALELHSRWALAALVATALHVIAVVANPHAGVSALAAIIPLASQTLTGSVALGTLALWGMVVVALTTALFRKMPRWAWRAVHASAFGSFLLALVHGIAAGSESGVPIVQGMYAGTAAVLLGAIIQRVLLGWQQAQARRQRSRG